MIGKRICARMALHGVVTALVLGAAGTSMAQPVPPDYVASPDIYKVVAKDDKYLVVEGSWKPGQRDVFHSHPAMLYYWVTPCTIRFHFPDGTTRDAQVSAGQAGAAQLMPSHVFENVGLSDCRIIMFEGK